MKRLLDWNGLFVLEQKRSLWVVFYDLLVCATPEDARFRPCVAAGPYLAD